MIAVAAHLWFWRWSWLNLKGRCRVERSEIPLTSFFFKNVPEEENSRRFFVLQNNRIFQTEPRPWLSIGGLNGLIYKRLVQTNSTLKHDGIG